MRVLNRAFDHPMELEERAADALAGGFMNGYQCGALWGATLAAGAQVYRLDGAGSQAQAKAMVAAQRLVKCFRDQNNNIDCFEITQVDLSSPTARAIARFLLKGAATGSCFGMIGRYAPVALDQINHVIAENNLEAPDVPMSCATWVAQKMGVSEMHQVMAAGFAGGIGLSGGGCGVLGAAIWINGLNNTDRFTNFDLNDPRITGVIEKFLESSDYEFECSKIVGRKFANVADHAGYLRDGGCSKIIEALAT